MKNLCQVKVGTINLIINIIILLIGCFQFGIKKLLYAIVVIIITSIIINLVMYKSDNCK